MLKNVSFTCKNVQRLIRMNVWFINSTFFFAFMKAFIGVLFAEFLSNI